MPKPKVAFAGCICYLVAFAVCPAKAGRLLGDYTSRYNDYRIEKATTNIDSAGLLLLSNGVGNATCSSVLISSYYALTSAHCFTGAKIASPNSARFASIYGDAYVTSYTIHKSFNKSGVYWNNLTKSNTPQQATYDIALVRLSTDMEGLGMRPAPLQPSTTAPVSPFTGTFTGFGRQGNGGTEVICNVPCSTATSLIDLASETYHGGENTINSFSTFFASDFDDGSFLRNIDNMPALPFEYAPDVGDSGSGLFDDTGKLLGLVSGGGYGTKVSPGTFNVFKYDPFSYGSLSIYTPLYLHTGWLTNMMKANPFPSTTIPIGTTGNGFVEVPFDPTGGLSGQPVLSGSIFNEGLVEIADIFSEVFSQDVYDEVYGNGTPPPPPPQESVPGPLPLLGIVTGFGISRRIRKKIREAKGTTTSMMTSTFDKEN